MIEFASLNNRRLAERDRFPVYQLLARSFSTRIALVRKIISAGRTVAYRAALKWAIAGGVPHRGACPKGRRVADGPIPDRYLLTELPNAIYLARTERNVTDSDGTLIVSVEPAAVSHCPMSTAIDLYLPSPASVQIPEILGRAGFVVVTWQKKLGGGTMGTTCACERNGEVVSITASSIIDDPEHQYLLGLCKPEHSALLSLAAALLIEHGALDAATYNRWRSQGKN